MNQEPLGKTAKLFLALYGSGFLILAVGFFFIVWKVTR